MENYLTSQNQPSNEQEDSEEVKSPPKYTFTKEQIIEALKVCLTTVSPLIKPTKTLQNMVFFILKSFFIDGKKYVVANCPTGSGKTIIGFITYFCTQYLIEKYIEGEPITSAKERKPVSPVCYFLTSNKALQAQIENDIDRFELHRFLYMLQGVSNYECIKATERLNEIKDTIDKKLGYTLSNRDKNFYEKVKEDNPQLTFASYKFRPCVGYSGEKLLKKFPECALKCPYRVAREIASKISCAILNYAYFLNVMRSEKAGDDYVKFFFKRDLTICDEAHLIPDIVCNMFNYEFSAALPKRIRKFFQDLQKYGISYSEELNIKFANCIAFFYEPINKASDIIQYVEKIIELKDYVKDTFERITKGPSSQSLTSIFSDTYTDIMEELINFEANLENIKSLINTRIDDVYFDSEEIIIENIQEFKHILKDLKEAELVKKHLLSKLNYGLFMSATLGDVDDYATLMGMDKDEYIGLMLPSTFDFSRSPIYLCESGYLNYNSFNRNIDKVLLDTIKICQNHSNEKGLIHTATFKITNLLLEKINQLAGQIDTSRFLFYSNTKEKEEKLNLLKNSNIPYILVGPSMYEGIDLPDDLCRFQVLVKVPYSQLTGYTKKKMERYPFWYKRNCVEKIIQAIGRSNRHKNDYSTIYLMDSLFEKIIYDTTDEIENRLEYKKIY